MSLLRIAARRPARRAWLVAAHLALLAPAAAAQSPFAGWQAGAVLDLSASSRELALGQRGKGLALGHSDLTASGALGPHLLAQGTFAFESDNGQFEGELEEAWLQTRTLPAGLAVRAGRFASQLGYLNEQHPHADDFVQRPLLYRAFLGGHWNDDGVRLNWIAPTDLYVRLGVELFRGRRLVEEAVSSPTVGAAVLSGRIGGDLGATQSWQAGLSLLHNRREAVVEAHEEHEGEEHEGEEDHEHEHEHEHHGHDHAHGAAFSGGRMWIADAVWKWAPDGNSARRQLRVAWEYAVVSDLNRHATGSDRHRATYLSVVYRFAPAWEAGVRHDRLRVREPHEDHFDDGRLRETALMLAYKPTHAQTLRLQFTRQRGGPGFDEANRAVQLQYILNFGAHAPHTF